jgi:hypothetical protein
MTVSDLGSLTVFVGSHNPSSGPCMPGTSHHPVLGLRLTANGLDMTVLSLAVSAQGSLNDRDHVTGVSLFEDVNADGDVDAGLDVLLAGPLTFVSDNGSLTFSGLSRTVATGSPQTWLVVYDLSAAAPLGDTFRAGVASGTHVVTAGSPAPPVYGPPVWGGTMTVSFEGAASVATGAMSPGPSDLPAGTVEAEMLYLTVTAGPTEDVWVSRVTVTAGGTIGSPGNLMAVSIYADANGDGMLDGGDTRLYGPTIFPPGSSRAVLWDINTHVLAGTAVEFFIVADIAETVAPETTLALSVVDPEDVMLTGMTSGGTLLPTGTPVHGSLMTVTGGAGTGGDTYIHRASGCSGPGRGTTPAGVLGLVLIFGTFAAVVSMARRRIAARG